jgi:hypothetical protein
MDLDPLRPKDTDDTELWTLVAFLNATREAVIGKATGVSDEQGRTPGVASGTSLLGMIKHLAVSEAYWFDVVFRGTEQPIDFWMDVWPHETAAGLIANYRAAISRSNAIIADTADLTTRSVGGQHRTLRWVILHMTQETARHAGHADILRENIDGSVGHRITT